MNHHIKVLYKGSSKKVFHRFVLIAAALLALVFIAIMPNQQGNKPRDKEKVQRRIPVSYILPVDTFYIYFKKHNCPACGSKLKIAYEGVIINSNSPEAKYYSYGENSSWKGDVEFRTGFFRCPDCMLEFSFGDIRVAELRKKKSH